MEAWNTLKSYVPPVPFSPTLWPLTKNTVHTDQSTYATRRNDDDKPLQKDGSNDICTLANFDRLDEAPAVTSPTKCEDSRGWVESLTDSVIFHVSLGYNLVQHDKAKQPWWDRVTDAPGIILGALPFLDKDHDKKLIEEGLLLFLLFSQIIGWPKKRFAKNFCSTCLCSWLLRLSLRRGRSSDSVQRIRIKTQLNRNSGNTSPVE